MNHKPYISVKDDFHAEDLAMLQALYSRSAAGVDTHLNRLRATGSSGFMKKYYVGYGHRSIADCGSTTMFLEGVSLLAAKAIQDSPLYCGQETSTRYIDMSSQPIVDPLGTPESKKILDRWMEFYVQAQPAVQVHIYQQYPKKPDEDQDTYERAVKARTFDIMRGFLPAGITTQLSWHSNLRQARDRLEVLREHPSNEIRSIANELISNLHDRYPSSGFDKMDKHFEWSRLVADVSAYHAPNLWSDKPRSTVNTLEYRRYRHLYEKRAKGELLPHFLSDLGQLSFNFQLDFGSFRDIQRHRNGVCRMPLLTPDRGFAPWYLQELPHDLRLKATNLIELQKSKIHNLDYSSAVERQYYCALGFQVPVAVTYGIPALVYVMELRSSRFVHPTLRKVVLDHMAPFFRQTLPLIPLFLDEEKSDWDVRRGQQTIQEKDS